MSELPYCVQLVQALGPTVVAVIAAFIAGYIAWRQWRTAHDKLSLDLFEKRFAVYEATKNFLNPPFACLGRVLILVKSFYFSESVTSGIERLASFRQSDPRIPQSRIMSQKRRRKLSL
jgi:hypothetical protein